MLHLWKKRDVTVYWALVVSDCPKKKTIAQTKSDRIMFDGHRNRKTYLTIPKTGATSAFATLGTKNP